MNVVLLNFKMESLFGCHRLDKKDKKAYLQHESDKVNFELFKINLCARTNMDVQSRIYPLK